MREIIGGVATGLVVVVIGALSVGAVMLARRWALRRLDRAEDRLRDGR